MAGNNNGVLTGDKVFMTTYRQTIYNNEGRGNEQKILEFHQDPRHLWTLGAGTAAQSSKGTFYDVGVINSKLQAANLPTVDKGEYQQLRTRGVKPSYTLTSDGVQQLLNVETATRAHNLEIRANNLNIDLGNLTSETRLAIADLDYRGQEGLVLKDDKGEADLKIDRALQRGDMGEVAYQIAYESNKDHMVGNDFRNLANAKDILDSLPPDEKTKALARYEELKRKNQARVDALKRRHDEYVKRTQAYNKTQPATRQRPVLDLPTVGTETSNSGHKPFASVLDYPTPSSPTTPAPKAAHSEGTAHGTEVFVHAYERRTGHVDQYYRSRPQHDSSENGGNATGLREDDRETADIEWPGDRHKGKKRRKPPIIMIS